MTQTFITHWWHMIVHQIAQTVTSLEFEFRSTKILWLLYFQTLPHSYFHHILICVPSNYPEYQSDI